MIRLVVLLEAEQDFLEALRWYADRSEEIGLVFEAAVNSAFQRVAEAPTRWPKATSRHRYKRVDRFPYRIVYRVLVDTIEVVAVAHTSRREFWRKR